MTYYFLHDTLVHSNSRRSKHDRVLQARAIGFGIFVGTLLFFFVPYFTWKMIVRAICFPLALALFVSDGIFSVGWIGTSADDKDARRLGRRRPGASQSQSRWIRPTMESEVSERVQVFGGECIIITTPTYITPSPQLKPHSPNNSRSSRSPPLQTSNQPPSTQTPTSPP